MSRASVSKFRVFVLTTSSCCQFNSLLIDCIGRVEALFNQYYVKKLQIIKDEGLSIEQYEDFLSSCDMCVIVFTKQFDAYLKEKYETAYREFKKGNSSRKLYIYCPNDLFASSPISDTIQYIEKVHGHFCSLYRNVYHLAYMQLEQMLIYLKIDHENHLFSYEDKQIVVAGQLRFLIEKLNFIQVNPRYSCVVSKIADAENAVQHIQNSIKIDEKESEYKDSLLVKERELSTLRTELNQKMMSCIRASLRIAKYRERNGSPQIRLAIHYLDLGDINRALNTLDGIEDCARAELNELRLYKKSFESERA